MCHLLLQIAASAGVLLLMGLWPQSGWLLPITPPPGGVMEAALPEEARHILPPPR